MVRMMQLAELKLTDDPNGQMVAVLEKPGHINLARAEIPHAGPGKIRVKIKWVGICGSDVEVYRGVRSPEFLSFPIRLGHEVSGVIDEIGEGVTGFKIGDYVCIRYLWGCFAQYVVCEPFNVIVLPSYLSLIDASLVEIMPSIMYAAERAEINPSKTVLIMGQGVSGLVLTQVISLFNPRVLVCTDLFEEKLTLSKRFGATHTYRVEKKDDNTMDYVRRDFPDGFDVVFPCLLEGDGIVDAVDCCAQNGRLVMYGCLSPCNRMLDLYKIHRKRIDIFSTEPKRDIDNRRFFAEGLKLVSSGLVRTGEIITHKIPLSKIDYAFQLRSRHTQDVIHVMVNCEE